MVAKLGVKERSAILIEEGVEKYNFKKYLTLSERGAKRAEAFIFISLSQLVTAPLLWRKEINFTPYLMPDLPPFFVF